MFEEYGLYCSLDIKQNKKVTLTFNVCIDNINIYKVIVFILNQTTRINLKLKLCINFYEYCAGTNIFV